MADGGRKLNLREAEGYAESAPADDLARPALHRGGGQGRRAEHRREERLSWLEAAPADDPDELAIDGARVARFLVVGLLVVAVVGGGAWWALRPSGPGVADGSLIRAEAGPYKVRPDDPGGKTFAGTGDSSYAVSEGQTRGAALAPADDWAAAAKADAALDAPSEQTGAGVQIGTYSDQKAAEAGWSALIQRHPSLSGLGHRVVEGRGDIGTLYRLQAIAANPAAAAELCQTLRDSGLGCQVR